MRLAKRRCGPSSPTNQLSREVRFLPAGFSKMPSVVAGDLVNTLIREGGMIAPDAMLGDIVEALADGGLFRLRGVLIETVAFQCY